MLVGFFSLLLITGGNASDSDQQEFYDDYPMPNLTMGFMPVSFEMEDLEPEIFPLIFEDIRVDIISANEVNISENCSFDAVLKHLNLTGNSDMYSLSRPVKHHRHLTWLFLEMKIYAILDVRETDQTFISYIWIYLRWDNEHIWWYPNDFCELDHILVPAKLLWMPDLTIEEMTEQDKASPSPYLNIRSHGWVEYRNDQVVISTCKMHVYKFPFDIQSCNISFKSIMYSDKELKLFYNKNNTVITEWSREAMQTQYEWLFISMTVTDKTVKHFGFNQTMIIYTIKMKRRSVLYIANFLLPVLFFLCLDLASLLMSDSGGEKVGFKITVLLAVTVMQLILNEILPCSSDRIPLIAVYCIGIFTLMLFSLLETILVMHLINKDSEPQENETQIKQSLNENHMNKWNNFHCCIRGIKKQSDCTSVSKGSADQSYSMTKEDSSNHLTKVSLTLEKVSDELEEIKKAVALLSNRKEDGKPGYWTRLARKINKFFTFFYVTSVILFLLMIFSVWILA
ncbi:5-hydroxytryptamine receptor 3A-like [Melanotaenia boesemani]|uniref:5-hydroxytryptamine receptor 3A-like n=1 Tax=Melanotaenia boesemani TaxID=1250792 RepID=UPI001C043506|nr:5-hydroxytryptamine receptor 3A-like [Melanotaenia boesemani]